MENKKYFISADNIERILDTEIGCIASDMITVHGKCVGYMYREEPEEGYDSGWRFLSGDESEDYVDDENNFSFYKINTIANYDRSIIPYLNAPVGSSFERIDGSNTFSEIIEE